MAGMVATRATNQHCSRHSRQKNGGRKACTQVSNASATKPPTSRSGFCSGLVNPTSGTVVTTSGPYYFAGCRLERLPQGQSGRGEMGSVLAHSPLLPAAERSDANRSAALYPSPRSLSISLIRRVQLRADVCGTTHPGARCAGPHYAATRPKSIVFCPSCLKTGVVGLSR